VGAVTLLPLWVERPDLPVSAGTWIALDVFAEWVHNQPCADTARMLMMLVNSLADERERYQLALFEHDLAAADESAAEQRDLVALAAMCKDHLREVGYRTG
jgi:hypothetical protein